MKNSIFTTLKNHQNFLPAFFIRCTIGLIVLCAVFFYTNTAFAQHIMRPVIDLATASDTGSSAYDNITDDTTPTFTIRSVGNSDAVTVTATRAGAPVTKTKTRTGPGDVTFDDPLGDGRWGVAVTAEGPEYFGTSIVVTINAVNTLDLKTSSDTGSSNTDNITDDVTPTFTISNVNATDTISVVAHEPGGSTVSETRTGSGDVTLTPLTGGRWTVVASADDGSTVSEDLITVTIDTEEIVSLKASSDTGPSDTDNITDDNTPTLTIDNVANNAAISVTASKTGESDVLATRTGPGDIALGTLAYGTWTIFVTETVSGSVVSADSIRVKIVGTTATVDLKASSDTGPSNTDNITGDSTPTITVGHVANNTDVTVIALQSGQTDVSETITGPGDVTLGTLADGEWEIAAQVTSGSDTFPGDSITVMVNTAEIINLKASSDSGLSSTDNITNDNTPTFTIDNVANDAAISVTASKTGEDDVSETITGPGDVTLGTLADGKWHVALTVTTSSVSFIDDPNSPGDTLEVVDSTPSVEDSTTVTIDTVETVLVDIANMFDIGVADDNIISEYTPPDYSSFTEKMLMYGIIIDNTPKVLVSANSGTSVTVLAEGGGDKRFTETRTGPGSVTFSSLSVGTWTITANAVDVAGNEAQSYFDITVVEPGKAIIDLEEDSDTAPENIHELEARVLRADNITKNNTPSFTVLAENVVTLKATNNADSTKEASGTWLPKVPGQFMTGTAPNETPYEFTDGVWSVTVTSEGITADPFEMVIDTAFAGDLSYRDGNDLTAFDPLIPLMSVYGNHPTFNIQNTDGRLTGIEVIDTTNVLNPEVVAVATRDGDGDVSAGPLEAAEPGAAFGKTYKIKFFDAAGNTSTDTYIMVFSGIFKLHEDSDTITTHADFNNMDGITSDNTPTFVLRAGFYGTVTVTASRGGDFADITAVREGDGEVTFPELPDGMYTVTATGESQQGKSIVIETGHPLTMEPQKIVIAANSMFAIEVAEDITTYHQSDDRLITLSKRPAVTVSGLLPGATTATLKISASKEGADDYVRLTTDSQDGIANGIEGDNFILGWQEITVDNIKGVVFRDLEYGLWTVTAEILGSTWSDLAGNAVNPGVPTAPIEIHIVPFYTERIESVFDEENNLIDITLDVVGEVADIENASVVFGNACGGMREDESERDSEPLGDRGLTMTIVAELENPQGGVYDDCTIQLTDDYNNSSVIYTVPSFNIQNGIQSRSKSKKRKSLKSVVGHSGVSTDSGSSFFTFFHGGKSLEPHQSTDPQPEDPQQTEPRQADPQPPNPQPTDPQPIDPPSMYHQLIHHHSIHHHSIYPQQTNTTQTTTTYYFTRDLSCRLNRRRCQTTADIP